MGIIMTDLGTFGYWKDYENAILSAVFGEQSGLKDLREQYYDQAVNIRANRHR